MRRLTLFRGVPANAKPIRMGARPRWRKYNPAWFVYDARRSEYERHRTTYETALPDAIRFPMITSMMEKLTSSSSRATMLRGESAGGCRRTTSRDQPRTMELSRLSAPDLTGTAWFGRPTMDRCSSTSVSGAATIDAVGITIFGCGVPRPLRQAESQWRLSSKRDRVSSFEDTRLASLALRRHHPARLSLPGAGGWRSSTEGSDHATAIFAGCGI